MNKTNKENWEEKFNKQFPDGSYEDMIKTFIRANFISKEHLREKVAELRKVNYSKHEPTNSEVGYFYGFHQALVGVLKLLEKTNNGK